MKRQINVLQLIFALGALVAVTILPYFKIAFLGITFYSFTALKGITGMYPVFWVLVIGMLALMLLTSNRLKTVSVTAGVIMLIVQFAFLALRDNIVLNGDITFILNSAGALISNYTGSPTDVQSVRLFLEPLLHAHYGFYIGVVLNVLYILAGLFLGEQTVGSAQNRGSRYDGHETHVIGRREY